MICRVLSRLGVIIGLAGLLVLSGSYYGTNSKTVSGGLAFCQEETPEEEEEPIQARPRPDDSRPSPLHAQIGVQGEPSVKDDGQHGDGAANEGEIETQPFSSSQTMRPSTPVQTMRPFTPVQSGKPSDLIGK